MRHSTFESTRSCSGVNPAASTAVFGAIAIRSLQLGRYSTVWCGYTRTGRRCNRFSNAVPFYPVCASPGAIRWCNTVANRRGPKPRPRGTDMRPRLADIPAPTSLYGDLLAELRLRGFEGDLAPGY